MDILVTGGAGFLGQQLIRALLGRATLRVGDDAPEPIDRLVCLDVVEGAVTDARVRNIAGDLTDRACVGRCVGPRTRLVVHLAAVVSGTAEADFDLGMRVNLDGTRGLLEACRALGTRPRMVYASSLAVFGGELPEVVTDATTPTPQGSYGIQKLIGEHLVQDYTRKGFLDGCSLRLPTVVVRPGRPNGAASGFASGIIREPLAGKAATLPVDPDTEMWLASPRAIVTMLLNAIEQPVDAWGWNRSLNLPGIVVRMGDEIEALRRVAGDRVVGLIRHQPDAGIARLVRSWPARFDTARALAMGFAADRDVDSIVQGYVEDHPGAIVVPVRA